MDPELWRVMIGPKIVHLPKQDFFKKTSNIVLIYFLAPFVIHNLKISLEWMQTYTDVSFWGPKWHNRPDFGEGGGEFGETINIALIYLLDPFIIQNIQNTLRADSELWGRDILGTKRLIDQNRKLLEKSSIMLLIYLLSPLCKIWKNISQGGYQ